MKRAFVVLAMTALTFTGLPAAGAVPVVTDDGDDAIKLRHQHGGTEGHLPGSSENVELVGKLKLNDVSDGRIADVAGFGNFAYLGAYGFPACRRGGVYVVDISDPANPRQAGFIQTASGSYVSEGVQVLHLDTPAFEGDVLVHNNEICHPQELGIGGISLWDVSNPRRPVALVEGFGDHTAPGQPDSAVAHQVHSAFAWDAGDKAYAIMVDDEEALDVDIVDITDPRNPVLIAETGLPDWPAAQDAQAAGMGSFASSFFHDLQVRKFGTKWIALLSYWDAGWVLLDVTDPANPVFADDTTYLDPDPVTAATGVPRPEGNAHQAWWSADGNFFLGTDEDLTPFRVTGDVTSGPFSGQQFAFTPGSDVPQIGPDRPRVAGPTVFVGQACTSSSFPDAPSADAIAVIERGTCTFTTKAGNVESKGYAAGIVFNSETGDPPCEAAVFMLVEAGIPMVFTARSAGFRILGITGYDPFDCPDVVDPDHTQPSLPAVGAAGSNVALTFDGFDGWGYVRLFDARTLREIDQLALPAICPAEAVSATIAETCAEGFGDVDVHEVETDDTRNLAYFAWYAGGFRVATFGRAGITEVGHYIDPNGNNFWGLDPHVHPVTGETIVLASDRDSGLWIFRYTGP